MRNLEDNYEGLEELNAIAVGISVDSTFCKRAWAKAIGVNKTRLLSDFWPHGGLARKLGVFREKEGFSERANILLDEDRRVIFVKVYLIRQVPDLEEIMRVLEEERR